MGYDNVLVPLDGSKLAELALPHALRIASPGAEIHLLSLVAQDRLVDLAALATTIGQVASFASEPHPATGSADLSLEIRARESYLDHIAESLRQKGYEVTVEVRPGKVVDTIASVTRDGFDIVVMATHGRTGFSKYVLGSVSEGVLHEAACPVLIV